MDYAGFEGEEDLQEAAEEEEEEDECKSDDGSASHSEDETVEFKPRNTSPDIENLIIPPALVKKAEPLDKLR